MRVLIDIANRGVGWWRALFNAFSGATAHWLTLPARRAGHCSTLTASGDHCSTLTAREDHCSTIAASGDHCSTITASGDHCLTITASEDHCSTITASGDHCSTITASEDHCSTLTASGDHCSTITASVGHCSLVLMQEKDTARPCKWSLCLALLVEELLDAAQLDTASAHARHGIKFSLSTITNTVNLYAQSCTILLTHKHQVPENECRESLFYHYFLSQIDTEN